MRQELATARARLEAALEEYLRVCSKLRGFYFPGAAKRDRHLTGTPDVIHDLFSREYVRSEISLCERSVEDIRAAKHDFDSSPALHFVPWWIWLRQWRLFSSTQPTHQQASSTHFDPSVSMGFGYLSL
ncbi:hypothetical protein RSAG8_08992, partial [Rhizoctonia solani AG-8 WAC10335]